MGGLIRSSTVLIIAMLGLLRLPSAYGGVTTVAGDREDSMTQAFFKRYSGRSYGVTLGNDNNDPSLPGVFRSWWYGVLNNVDRRVKTTLFISNLGHPHRYLPVFSYDGEAWQSFPSSAVVQVARRQLVVKYQFKQSKVWVARSEPYTYDRLRNYLAEIEKSPFARVTMVAKSRMGFGIPFLTLSNFKYPAENRRRIWIHARTHPGETATNFVLEGLVDYLLNSYYGQRLLKFFIFSIVPMHNVDGVVVGNNRVTPLGENLEELWHFDANTKIRMKANAPYENRILADIFTRFQQGPHKVQMALNIHSTNGAPNFYPHFMPHFGHNRLKFTPEQVSLYRKQVALIQQWRRLFSFGTYAHLGPGNADFLKKNYPETWIWRQYKDQVMAMTFESTYGLVPGKYNYFTSREHREMGRSLAHAILAYFHRPQNLTH